MVLVIVTILLNKVDKKEGRIILKRIKPNLNEILRKFVMVTVKKALRDVVDEINELIIDFFETYEKFEKFD